MYEKFEQWLNDILDSGLFDSSMGIDFQIRKLGADFWGLEAVNPALTKSYRDCIPTFRFSSKLEDYQVQMEVMRCVSQYCADGKHGALLKNQRQLGVGFTG